MQQTTVCQITNFQPTQPSFILLLIFLHSTEGIHDYSTTEDISQLTLKLHVAL